MKDVEMTRIFKTLVRERILAKIIVFALYFNQVVW